MTLYRWKAALAVVLVVGVTVAAETVPEPEAAVAPPAGGITNPDATRAEALLTGAGIPFAVRNDLIPTTFPSGCFWLAVYGTAAPEVVLEAFAFTDVGAAEDYVTNRNADFETGPSKQSHMIVNNGSLVLVARFAETGDDRSDARAYSIMSDFAAAFVR